MGGGGGFGVGPWTSIFLTGALGDSGPSKVTKHLCRFNRHAFVQFLLDCMKKVTVN